MNRREYMHKYQAMRRGRLCGFNVDLALAIHNRLLEMNVDPDDARWAVLDAAREGIFGEIPRGIFGRNGWVR